MSMAQPQPIKNLDSVVSQDPQFWARQQQQHGVQPHHQHHQQHAVVFGNDVDSVDVATRVAMVRFFNSPSVLGNFAEHTRTLRLHPRPVVAFQYDAFVSSRGDRLTEFTKRLARTQAVEYFAEWSLRPDNSAFQRIHTGLSDPAAVGDKPKWFSQRLQRVEFAVCRSQGLCTLSIAAPTGTGAAAAAASAAGGQGTEGSDNAPTDESGCSDFSDGDGATGGRLTDSSSYSSLTDFVSEMISSDINTSGVAASGGGHAGNPTAAAAANATRLAVDLTPDVFQPPNCLQLPGAELPAAAAATLPSASSSAIDDDRLSSELFRQSGRQPRRRRRKRREQQRSLKEAEGQCSSSSSSSFELSDAEGQRSSGSELHLTSSARAVPPRPPPPKRVGSIGSHPGTPEGAPRVARAAADSQLPSSRQQQRSSEAENEAPPPSGGLGAVTHVFDSFALGPAAAASSEQPTHPNSLVATTQQASSAIGEFFSQKTGANRKSLHSGTPGAAPTAPTTTATSTTLSTPSTTGQFAPLGAKRSVVETSALMRQAQGLLRQQQQQQQQKSQSVLGNRRTSSSSSSTTAADTTTAAAAAASTATAADQAFLKDIATSVLDGQGVGFLKGGQLRTLMENENYRNLLLARLNHNLLAGEKLTDTSQEQQLPDRPLRRSVFKGLLTVLKAMIGGLERAYRARSSGSSGGGSAGGGGGFASTLMLLEVAHTHYWQRDIGGSGGSGAKGNLEAGLQKLSPFGSQDSLSATAASASTTPASGELEASNFVATVGPPVMLNGEEYENIEVRGSEPGTAIASSSSAATAPLIDRSDQMRELRVGGSSGSIRPDAPSDASPSSDCGARPPPVAGKTRCSSGYRFTTAGQRVRTLTAVGEDTGRTYLFEMVSARDRSQLWDQLQFWEDAFLDAVATERDIVGMDQGPNEMMSRYESLGKAERKRLELDEDRLLSTMLYNLTAFMVMMRVDAADLRKKVRRLLGKSHIGLHYSQEINCLLDQISGLSGNDVDLKPPLSRFIQKQSFAVHCGQDKTGDLRFLEVCPGWMEVGKALSI